MISVFENKYCCNPTLIEGRDKALQDPDECWKVVHRNFFSRLGVVSKTTLKELDLFWLRPANELIYMTRDEYRKCLAIHNRQVPKTNNISVWRFWHMLNPNKLLCECSPEEYHHLANLSITLRNRIKALKWNVENDPRYKFKIYRLWAVDNNAFILWALKNGFKDPSQEISRIDKSKPFEPSNLKIVQGS